ncbi:MULTISPECIES: hypothetical protein [unclassified Janthinobacterium]|uniref:hypothetical protein n=1 Tax=unclassified Janthinobacterium TaxID=2610881 RepID=UPI00161C6FAF|nr:MULTISPECIES: hypothetical protein [unclassified Janthinobacterium]MBB5367388.1 hypothetical protein [Janthinobacterium sp. K2C7]MBB5380134.1 hypothetical protein [Janthinobacterium sp. K2Li3]MBB5385770.1 hypothetical protein [Janthinobacterium sp. K2E3]
MQLSAKGDHRTESLTYPIEKILMSNRRLINVSRDRQRQLSIQFEWLHSVHEKEKHEDVQVLSVSTFDHWLSHEDASRLLENVPPEEQERRNKLLAAFCGKMVAGTEVLSFAMRGRRKDRCIFRAFKSSLTLTNYCRPNGGRLLGHRHFCVVLPELGCAFYESWDDTYHFFFTTPEVEDAARNWATQSKVYLLSHNSVS